MITNIILVSEFSDETRISTTIELGRETSEVLRGSCQQEMIQTCDQTDALKLKLDQTFSSGKTKKEDDGTNSQTRKAPDSS